MQRSAALYREYLIAGFSQTQRVCLIKNVHSVLWKETVRSGEAFLHGNRQINTKTSHHPLCMTSAGIITPIVCDDWYTWYWILLHQLCSAAPWTWQWNFNASCLMHGELILSSDGSRENDTTEYLFYLLLSSPHWQRWCSVNLTWLNDALCLLRLCVCRSQWLYFCKQSYLLMRRI